jgi:hypothetical protein
MAMPNGVHDRAHHRVDHGEQQLALIPEHPPGLLQDRAPLRARHVVQAGQRADGVEATVRERQPPGIAPHIRTGPGIDIDSDAPALLRAVPPHQPVRTAADVEQQAAAARQRRSTRSSSMGVRPRARACSEDRKASSGKHRRSLTVCQRRIAYLLSAATWRPQDNPSRTGVQEGWAVPTRHADIGRHPGRDRTPAFAGVTALHTAHSTPSRLPTRAGWGSTRSPPAAAPGPAPGPAPSARVRGARGARRAGKSGRSRAAG